MNNNEWKWKVVLTMSGCKTFCSVFWVRKQNKTGGFKFYPAVSISSSRTEKTLNNIKLLMMPKIKRHTCLGVTQLVQTT